MTERRTARYLGIAAVVGVAWYLALLIPPWTRQMLFPGPGNIEVARTYWAIARALIIMTAISVTLAILFRPFIQSWTGFWPTFTLSLCLPLVGSSLFPLFLFLPALVALREGSRFSDAIAQTIFSAIAAPVMVVTRAFYVAVPMGLVSQLVMSRAGRADRQPIDRRLWIALALSALLALPCAVWVERNTGKRIVTQQMSWSEGEPSTDPASRHIILTFVEHPRHSIGIHSRDLGEYLESLPSREVPVTFELTYDFGSLRSFREVRIGTLERWQNSGTHHSVHGDDDESLWPGP